MATRSLIGIQNTDGSVTFAYCHWDGYPSGVGKDIVDMGRREARALINKGDMSSVGQHYHADRGEDWERVKPRTVANVELFLAARFERWCDYVYLLNKWGTWKFATHGTKFMSLRGGLNNDDPDRT